MTVVRNRKSAVTLSGTKSGTAEFILGGFAVVGLLAVYGVGESRAQLIAVASGGALLCLAGYILAGRLLPQFYASRLLIASYALQLVALAAIAALGLTLSPPFHPFEVNAAEAPFRVVLAILTVPAGALIAAMAWWVVSRPAQPAEKNASVDNIAKPRRIYLVAAVAAMLLYWPAALENSGVMGYGVRVLASALMMAPFLAGRDSATDRRLGVLWVSAILVSAVVGIAAGSRSKAFIAAVLFGAGYVSTVAGGRRRVVVGAFAVLAMVPLIQFAGALGVVRDELGRGGLELARVDHIKDVLEGTVRQMTADPEQVTMHGAGRFLAWTNVVVPLMTPESIPYRRFDGFVAEASQTFQVASVSGRTLEDSFDAGLLNASARVYGFTVNSETSFDFTLLADGWSRGGAPIALLFSFIAALGFTIGERFAAAFHRWGAGVVTIVALPAAKAAFFDSTAYGLLPTLRSMILYILILALLVIGTEWVRQIHSAWRRPYPTATRRPADALPRASNHPRGSIQARS
jgi:hypothetical protein